MYKNYIFDLYGTLVNIKTNEKRKRLWDKFALFYSLNGASYSADEIKKVYLEEVKSRLKDNNKILYPDIKLQLVFQKLFIDKGVETDKSMLEAVTRLFRVLSIDHLELYPGVIEMLEKLKTSGKRIFMLSNGQREFTVPELKYLGIYKYFDGLYSSSDIGICKPDKAFFDYVIEKEKLDRQESLYVGNDDICDVGGAKAAFLDCLYIHSNLSRNIKEVDSTYAIWDGDINKIIDLTYKS